MKCHAILVAAALGLAACSGGERTGAIVLAVGDAPVVGVKLNHGEIAAGATPVSDVFDHGELLFGASFNTLDGAGRPDTSGTGNPRPGEAAPHNFNRISGPDANACAGCHFLPRIGGGGGNVANVFVLAQDFPHLNFDGGPGDNMQNLTLKSAGNERATVGMFGAGYIELLAREITATLHSIRDQAIADAMGSASTVVRPLTAKGVSYGQISVDALGTVDTSMVDGLDGDLIVKPFHQKGVVVSLREFSNNAMNHHHGIQSMERFGADADPDNDGVTNELSEGDITAVTLFQALLPPPGRVLPADPGSPALAAIAEGETLFSTIGCATCHVPEMELDDPVFTEPGPYNPAGNLVASSSAVVSVDLTTEGPSPRLPRRGDGKVVVRAYTDFKRHDMGPGLNNEQRIQAGVPTNEFLTKKLWGMTNEPPFMHHGRALDLSEAILMHGGDAQAARDAFDGLSASQQDSVIEFLKTLQVLPEDATTLTVTAPHSGVIGDEPAVVNHVDQAAINANQLDADVLFEFGFKLFGANFNRQDGAGRPESTGTGAPRARREGIDSFNRLSGPDANSCFDCHNLPRSGGGGDNVANVFVLAQALPFINFDGGEGDGFNPNLTLKNSGNERNTPGMWGAGYIEMLAREMTATLQQQRDDAVASAISGGTAVTVNLMAKGVSFGQLTAAATTGTLDLSAVTGIDEDLVLKPFHQKGVVVSLREFTNNAMNHHHGMQSSERFGPGLDPDNDGHTDELTVGDQTATTVYQALLAVPGRVLPADPERRAVVDMGELLFESVGCASCHVPSLELDDPMFSEPNPYNPPNNLRVADVPQPFVFDLGKHGPGPRLPRNNQGKVNVPAYTDLKRHDLGMEVNNEVIVQGGVPTSVFLTKKLWGFASEPPFMHHGRATTIREAIELHGGDAAGVRTAFRNLDESEQAAIIDFLKTLQVLPKGSPLTVVR